MLTRKILSPEHPVIVSLVFFMLTLLFTYPAIFQLSDHLIGGADDAWICPWNDFNFRERILHGEDPYYTNYIFAPVGTSLLMHANSEFNSVVGFLVSPFYNEVAQTNLAILIASFLSALGMYVLARSLNSGVAGAYFAAIGFAFCPFLILRMVGQTNFATSQGLPFSIWSFLRLAETQKRRYIFATAIFFALTYYSNQYYAVYLLITFCVILAYGLWKFPSWRNVRLPLHLFAAAGLALVLFTPLAIRFYKDYREGVRYPTEASESLALASDANVVDYLKIGPHNHFIQKFVDKSALDAHAKYTSGWIVLLCAGIALILAVRTRNHNLILFGIIGLVFLFFSLGPFAQIGSHRILLPYRFLQMIPFINNVRIPSRFAIMVTLSLATCSAFTISWLAHRGFRLIVCVLFGLLLFELFPAPLYMDPFDPPDVFYQLRNKEDGLMLTLPFYVGKAPASRLMSFQLAHRKQLLAGRLARGGAYPVQQYFANIPVTESFLRITEGRPKAVPHEAELAPVFRKFLNVRYLAVHPPFSQRPPTLQYVRNIFPDAELLSAAQGIQVYSLPRVEINDFEFHSGQEGIRLFLFQNWEPQRGEGKRYFVCRKDNARILLPHTTPDQTLKISMKLRSTNPIEANLRIASKTLHPFYLNSDFQIFEVTLPGQMITEGHQLLTIQFDPDSPYYNVELERIQASVERRRPRRH